MPKQILAAGGLVTNAQGEILWIFRRGFWDLPKGKLDDGETIQSCAIREVEEETGIQNIKLHELLKFCLKLYHNGIVHYRIRFGNIYIIDLYARIIVYVII